MIKKYLSTLFVFSLLGLLLLSACDKIEPPYKQINGGDNDTVVTRKFLLEEFTGTQCPNCPQGAIKAQELKAVYGERLIVIAIHAGDFAIPGSGEFATDFRSTTGNDIYNFFTPMSFPSGMISRTGWTQTQNNAVIDKDSWGARIETIKNDSPKLSIELTNAYEPSTRKVSTSLEMDALMDFSGTYKICAYLTEDSIITAQLTESDPNYPDNIMHSYALRHVLRGALNSTWGDTLVSGSVSNNAQFLKNYSMVLNTAWNENKCYVVALIYDASNYEVIQAEEKKVK